MLARNWTIQSPDVDKRRRQVSIAAELDAEFDRLQQLMSSDPQNVKQRKPGHFQAKPPTNSRLQASSFTLHGVYDPDEIDAIRKGVGPRPAREEPAIHIGSWNDLLVLALRDYQIF